MARIARVVETGLSHHITQRGNNHQDVFLSDGDRLVYLSFILKCSVKYGLAVLAYCLMNNHVHFIAIPQGEDSMAKTFRTAHMRYAQYFNKEHKRSGHLWQGRFYSCVLSESHLIRAARYVERNPVRAGLVTEPWQWAWSSSMEHIRSSPDATFSLKSFFDLTEISLGYWKEYISSEEDAAFLSSIRRQTLTGRPLGESGFIEGMEKKSGRDLSAGNVGRPKKSVVFQ